MIRLGLAALAICLVSTQLSAQVVKRDTIANGLAPTGALTRSLFRRIEVIPGKEEEVLKAVKEQKLPSLDLRVGFNYDSDVFTEQGVAAVKELGEALSDPRLKTARILLVGHTDARGAADYNQALSERRARAVREHLIRDFKIDEARLEAIGFGKRKLLENVAPEDGANRRVEVVNLIR